MNGHEEKLKGHQRATTRSNRQAHPASFVRRRQQGLAIMARKALGRDTPA